MADRLSAAEEAAWLASGPQIEESATIDHVLRSVPQGVEYAVAVRVRRGADVSRLSPVQIGRAQVPVSAVTGLAGAAGAADGQIVWTWTPVDGADQYGLEWVGPEGATMPITSAAATWTLNAIGGNDYRARVRVRIGTAWGPWSDFVTVRAQVLAAARPGAPTVAAGTSADGVMDVSWTAVANANQYVWAWRTGSGDWTESTTTGTTGSYTGTVGTAYDFRVKAQRDGAPDSDWSPVTSFTAARVPGPRGFSKDLILLSGGIAFQRFGSFIWRAPLPVDLALGQFVPYDQWSIRIRRLAADGTPGGWRTSTAEDGVNITTYGIQGGQVYEVQIRGMDSTGWGPWTESKSFRGVPAPSPPAPLPPPPPEAPPPTAAPAVGLVTATETSLTFDFGTVARAAEFRYRYRAVGTAVDAWLGAGSWGTARRRTITGLVAGTTYRVQGRARNAQGLGPWPTRSTAMTTLSVGEPPPPPPRPQVPTATQGATTQTSISWTINAVPTVPDTGATYYEYRYGSTGSWTRASAGTTITRSGLVASTTYVFQVRAGNSSGASGVNSYQWRTATPPPTPVFPTIRVSIQGNNLVVSWTNTPTYYVGLTIIYGLLGGDRNEIARFAGNPSGPFSVTFDNLSGRGAVSGARVVYRTQLLARPGTGLDGVERTDVSTGLTVP